LVGEMHGTWNMTNKTKGINAVYTQVLIIRLNRIRSTLGNYKQVEVSSTWLPLCTFTACTWPSAAS